MNDFNQLMKQAQQMQAKLLEAQNKLNELELVGSSGGGMVTVIITGKGDMKRVIVDPKLLSPDDADVVGDLVVAAFNDAKSKLETKLAEQMGGFLPPGMKMPF
ncbi:MAG: YbaB/EbfC family nucleoid-associated protein [Holosporaceae bacterium]|jgi:DNA-binding YbaB/EbfC family protein|nr:YbaB/EbfC family nucleoid-associated protein [Holosporaceae bacterium]